MKSAVITTVPQNKWRKSIAFFPPADLAIGYNMPLTREIQNVLSELPVISLEEMSDVKLMNRKDTKYLVNSAELPELIAMAKGNYLVQEIDNCRIASYGTLYLDTAGLCFYHAHMNGKLNHMKWRVRSYFDSQISFLEIKKKSNTGRTRKNRILIDPSKPQEQWIADFVRAESNLAIEQLSPILQNNFNRVTLVDQSRSERLTIDFNITFKNYLNGESVKLQNLGIIEIKHDRCCDSFMRRKIAEMRIKKAGVSKYCLGIALSDDQIKRNAYKRKIRFINKITNQYKYHDRA
jgi:hypothetical protein